LPTAANDEDRQRQGFEIQTVFAWPWCDGIMDVAASIASDDEGPILSLTYAPGATISRLNKGLRRRKDKTIFGWTGSKIEGDDDEPDKPERQRVVPIVQDNKNALLLQLPGPALSETAIATLQHALARGLEIVFQLEEGEVLTEPVPTRISGLMATRYRLSSRSSARALIHSCSIFMPRLPKRSVH
jgi:hypothetical protein